MRCQQQQQQQQITPMSMHLCYIALETQFHCVPCQVWLTAARRGQPVALACVRRLHAYKQSRSCQTSPEFSTRWHLPATLPIILKREIRLKSIKEAEIRRSALNCLYAYSIDVAQGRQNRRLR